MYFFSGTPVAFRFCVGAEADGAGGGGGAAAIGMLRMLASKKEDWLGLKDDNKAVDGIPEEVIVVHALIVGEEVQKILEAKQIGLWYWALSPLAATILLVVSRNK